MINSLLGGITMAYKPEEKLQIVLEGLKEDITITDLCKKYGISRDSYYTWKKELKEGATKHWDEKKPGRKSKDEHKDKNEIKKEYQKLKEKNLELKKKLEGVTIQRDFAQYQLKIRNEEENSNKKKD